MVLCITVNSCHMVTQCKLVLYPTNAAQKVVVQKKKLIYLDQNSPWKEKQIFLNLNKLGKVIKKKKNLKIVHYLCHPEEPKQAKEVGTWESFEI